MNHYVQVKNAVPPIVMLWAFAFSLLIVFFLSVGQGFCLGWPDLTVRMLPDSSFAMVEVDESGKRFRRCPIYDANGNLDMEQLIYVLGTFDRKEWLYEKNRKSALRILEKHFNSFKTKALKNKLQQTVNINKAMLSELAVLPNVGPVLAVRIAEYREANSPFLTPEDVKNVEGVGIGTFNAIRHYIHVD